MPVVLTVTVGIDDVHFYMVVSSNMMYVTFGNQCFDQDPLRLSARNCLTCSADCGLEYEMK